MARRLIVDSGVLIAADRGDVDLGTVVSSDDDLAVSSITVAELRAGVELSSDVYRKRREGFLQRVLSVFAVEVYDIDVADEHGRLIAHARRRGRPRGAHDLIIAATALTRDRTILTTDARAGFSDLPGVDAVVVGTGG